LKAANYADMKSHGIELLLNGTILKQRDFTWKATLTIGYNTTKITNVKNLPQIFDLVKAEGGNKEGYPVNSLFSIKYSGLNHATGIPEFLNESGEKSSSVYVQSDSTGNLKYEGSVDPKYTGGLNNTFTYKALSLNIFVTYQWGNKIRLSPAFRDTYSEWDATPKEFYNRWAMPGEESVKNVVPSIMGYYESVLQAGGSGYPYTNYNYSTERVAKGDLIRLKSVSLSYQLPASLMEKTNFLKTVSVTLAATNPWLIYSDKKLEGQDPEFFNAGGVAQPVQKQMTLALRIGL
jgi:hypothetical protein